MKRKKMYVLGLFATMVAVFMYVTSREKTVLPLELAMSNIESLAYDESGDGGTEIKNCLKKITSASSGTYYLKCNSSTTTSMIYKCPTTPTEGYKNDYFLSCLK